MKLRAFDSIEELDNYCESLDNQELADIIERGFEEYGYKINVDECTFTRYELKLMSEILDNTY